MGIVMIAFATYTIGLIAAREEGILKRLHGSPLPSWCYFVARIATITLLTLLSTAIALIVARTVNSFEIKADMILPLCLTILLGSIGWASLGTAICGMISDAGSGQTILTVIWLPVILVSGIFFPLSGEPSWLQSMVKLLPAEPIASNISATLSNSSTGPLATANYIPLVLWTGIGAIIALATFSWERKS
jgi:ABC-2 type transport system permease protein